jgi:hypothetical protein
VGVDKNSIRRIQTDVCDLIHGLSEEEQIGGSEFIVPPRFFPAPRTRLLVGIPWNQEAVQTERALNQT